MEFSPDVPGSAAPEPATLRAMEKLKKEMEAEKEAAGKTGPVAEKIMRGYARHSGDRVDVKETGKAPDSTAVQRAREDLAKMPRDAAVDAMSAKIYTDYTAPSS